MARDFWPGICGPEFVARHVGPLPVSRELDIATLPKATLPKATLLKIFVQNAGKGLLLGCLNCRIKL
jgi:hypothetical protein